MNNKERFAKVLDEIHNTAVKNKDFELPFNQLRMDEECRLFSLDKQNKRGSLLSDFATTQLLTKAEMPVRYMKKLMEESPKMVAEQFNLWASKQDEDKNILIRGQKGEGEFLVRGVLSDKYTIMDNKDVVESLIDVADQVPDFEIVDVFHNDKKLHMRLAFPDLYENFGSSVEGKEDIIRVGLDIQNSEIGYSSLMIAPITYRLVCTNGLKIWKKEEGAFKQRHVHLDSDELRRMMEVTMKKSVEKGKELIDGMRESRKVEIINPYEYIDGLGVQYNLSGKAVEGIKRAYDIESERNLFAVVNGFTRYAQSVNSHDSRLHLETIASEIMLPA